MIQIDDKTFEDIIRVVASANKLLAIKLVATYLKMNLKDSKEFVESL